MVHANKRLMKRKIHETRQTLYKKMSKRDEFPPESGAPRAEAVSDKKPKYPISNTPRSFWPKYTEDSSKRRVKLIAKSILIEVNAIGREGKIYSWKRKSHFNPHRSPRQLIGLWIARWRHHYGFSNKQRQSIINIIIIQLIHVFYFISTPFFSAQPGVAYREAGFEPQVCLNVCLANLRTFVYVIIKKLV